MICFLQVCFVFSQLAEAQTALSLAHSAQVRGEQTLRERTAGMVDGDKYRSLQDQLLAAQSKAREYETALQQRATETTKLIHSKNHGLLFCSP